MTSRQCLERQLQQQLQPSNLAGRTEDVVPSTHSDVGEDADIMKASGMNIDAYWVPRPAYASIFEVTSPPTACLPVIPLMFRLRLLFMDRPDSLRGSVLEYQGMSAPHDYKSAIVQLKQARLQQSSKQPGRNVDGRGTEEMTTAEPHVSDSDDNDVQWRANISESCGKEQQDPSAVEHDAWEDLHSVHHGPVAMSSETTSVMRSSTAFIVVGSAPRVDVVGEGWLHLPWRPQQLGLPVRPPVQDRRARLSAYASIFDVASPSIARFPGTLFLSWPPLLYLDERGRLRGTTYWPSFQSFYWPELDECTKHVCRGTPTSRHCNDAGPQLKQALLQQSSKQPGRSVVIRVTEEMTTPEPHFGHSDNDAELYARNSMGYGNAQLHPPAVKQD
ncbi:hypothetical protein HPB51_027137 [Rhipicephalus microplus]|uniref:Uncharacterized protein n=1 Tax=Rhipicephalus microplus TaxID=6941 RepID=A0A9J6D101_RHIMP|nr:hypothetical protein HPB51_027137 [Rhipicephalus microplus]